MRQQTLPTTPRELRQLIRSGELTGPTPGLAPGYVQANLAILPKDLAFDFLLFCHRNPKPCPLVEVVEAGLWEPARTAPGADLRVDLPGYRVFRDGELVAEERDITEYWRDDLVSFLIGCSFTFDHALVRAGIPLRHLQEGKVVSMYVTNISTIPAGVFHGPMVVSMRPIPQDKVLKAVQTTSRYPSAHGAPIHIGDPETIGIRDLARPDLGDLPELRDGEVPVFWACGVTPQLVAMSSRPSLMITHAPGHMFITDLRDEELAVR
ncbi:MAG: putative hydro-lyase [Dehalococcoidia bacterium]